MAETSPEGLLIGRNWRVGKRIGQGEFGSVHCLLDISSGKQTDFVVKLVQLPTKITKKKGSIAERNARILHYETIVYQCQLPEYQGDVIPMLPSSGGPPASGDIDGFRFLVMERMKAPLCDIIPLLMEEQQTTISIGPIAVQLLHCVQTFHENGQIVIDIKPENFMLSSNKTCNLPKKKGKPSTSNVQEIASQIRLLDLGLLRQWKGAEGHKPNEGISEVIGTPLYASLNVHAKDTPSRRDDLEALGYLVAELVIQLVATARGLTKLYGTSFLPWSEESSDELMGQSKESEVTNYTSEFYNRMGGSGAAETMKQYLDVVRSYKYKETPNYDKLRQILSQLKVNTGVANKKKNKRRSRSETTATTVAHGENESPKKMQRMVTIDDDDSDGTLYEDAEENLPEDMDWEPFPDENDEPVAILDNSKSSSSTPLGMELIFEEGPHKGETLTLVKNSTESFVIGRNPQIKKGEKPYTVSKDSEIGDTHVRLELEASKKLCCILVTDLRSTGGTWVNKSHLTRGKSSRAFRSDKIRIGRSTIRIYPLNNKACTNITNSNERKEKPVSKKGITGGASPTKKAKIPGTLGKKLGVRVVIIDGPHLGDEFLLVKGETESLNIGSNPSSNKKADVLMLGKDADMEANHIRLDLVANKKLVQVNVTDLKSHGNTSVNGEIVPKGKHRMAFRNDKIKIGETILQIKAL